MLALWEMWCNPLSPSFQGPLRAAVSVPGRVLYQIELKCVLILN